MSLRSSEMTYQLIILPSIKIFSHLQAYFFFFTLKALHILKLKYMNTLGVEIIQYCVLTECFVVKIMITFDYLLNVLVKRTHSQVLGKHKGRCNLLEEGRRSMYSYKQNNPDQQPGRWGDSE